MSISTHVLDTARGCPAGGITVTLERWEDGAWTVLDQGPTDEDGRRKGLLAGAEARAGLHRISFEIGPYHDALGVEGFYPRAAIEFQVTAPEQHHHVPLLLSPFGYSTYRGS